MEKCRLCLGNKKNLLCIFDVVDEHSFADMIKSISNIKILENDGVTDKICLACRKKLKEAFEFRSMIIRSDAALQCYSNCKKICFDTLNDIKIKVEITDEKYIPKNNNDNFEYFKNDKTTIFYNGTTIKKVEPVMKTESQPLLVMDFLNTIKDDPESDFDDNYNVDFNYEPASDDDDNEYLLPLSIRRKAVKKNRCKSKKGLKNTALAKNKELKSNSSNTSKLKTIPKPIKPLYMSDLRVVPTKQNNGKKPKVPKRYKNYKKEICYYCGKMTGTLKQHLLSHTGERSFKCDKCSKGFLTEKDLAMHLKRHIHASERYMKCDLCVATFGCKEALRSHMISHSDEKGHVCEICSKPFKRKGALRRHQLMHNITNKNIKCELCTMSFFSKYGLNHHMRVHTGERPYNCEICSQPYSYKHDFNRHCLKKHGVFLKRRSVNIMNEEVLKRERALMRDIMLKLNGFVNDDENINPFDGPQGAQAFELAVKALKSKQIPIDL